MLDTTGQGVDVQEGVGVVVMIVGCLQGVVVNKVDKRVGTVERMLGRMLVITSKLMVRDC